MTTGRESVCCREHQKSCDKIPAAMSCITENENFCAVCTNPAVIETAFSHNFENEGPIDDEPLNEYVYHMHLFVITLLCNKHFLNMKMMLLSYFGLHGVTSSLPILVLGCDSYMYNMMINSGYMVGFFWGQV